MTPTTTFDPMLTASSMSSSSDLMLSDEPSGAGARRA